ncbi:UNVERIFIED_CONTAM: hypothetical protein FKN15_050082 [Acipenser sinensis]
MALECCTGSCTEMSDVNKDMSATEENTETPNAPASYPCAQLVKQRTPVPTPRTRVPVSILGTADPGSPTSWEIHVAEMPENSMAMSPPIMSTTGFTKSSPEEGELVQEESLTISKQHFIRHIIEKHAIHRGLSLTALSARERRRLLRQQEDACRLKEMDGKNKEKLPCHAVFGEEGQLRLKETTPQAEKKALEDLEKIIEDSFKPKRSKSSSETSTEHDQDQDYSKLVEDDPTGSTQLQPIADNTTPAATEESNASSKGTIQDDSSLLKLQALEVDLCSSFLPAQEDGAQLQHPKEHSLQAGHAAQGKDANTREPQPTFRNCQNEADIQAEAQQCPGTSRLLHHITDGDNPQPSPRCPSFSQSQRFNTDPESAPSPPCSQQFRMSRGIVRGDPPETAKEPVSVTLLTKHIQNVKKKIRKYEETFEQERKYRPSHNDKTANPEIFKLMNDLAKSRKQLKDLKLKMSVKELREQGSQQRELCRVNSGQQGAVELQQKPCLEETVESLIMRLREKRTALGLPENMKPSHNDKTANPEIFKLMNDLAKSRKQLKDLKLKMSVKELREQGSQQRELCRVNSGQQGAVELQQKPCLEETVESLIMRLREKRTALGLPENMKEMTQKQMALEKVTLQKCLLYFESLHGRPGTKQERNLMKPLYDRYRMIKQFLCATSSITTIEEEGSDEENMQHNPLPPSRIISQNSSDESLCPYEEDNEPTFVSPLDEMKAVRQTVTMSNLHEASMPELLEHLRETRAEKKRLRKALRDYEDQFLRQMGRTAQKEDRIPMAEEYCEFKLIKAKLKLLEVLVSKRGAAQTTTAQKEDRIPMAEEYCEFKQIKAKLKLLEVLVSKRGAAQTT